MKALLRFVTVTAGTVFLSALVVSAQGPNAGKNTRMYDPATELTLKGTVEDVKQETRGRMAGTHLVVKAGDATKEVMLGPSAFISSKGFSFAKGDSVEVAGSKIAMAGTEYIIAREVVKAGKTLTLRDKNGIPQWAGRGGDRGTAKN